MSAVPNLFATPLTIAIVGISDNPERYSYKVAAYLKEQGNTIIPINPNISDVLGLQAYPDLLAVPSHIQIDVLDVFRKSEYVLPHVQEAVSRGDVQTIWMQEGVSNQEAAEYAQARGLSVVMNMCMMVAHKNSFVEKSNT